MGDDILSPRQDLVATFFRQGIIPSGGNSGLVFDRYLPIWNDGKRADRLFPPLSAFAQRFNEMKGENQPLLDHLHARQNRFTEQARKNGKAGTVMRFAVSWRLVSGMGNDHPLENGFTMDHLTGVPFIRSTALKGLCRRAADLFGEEDGWDAETLITLFGSRDPMASESLDTKERGDIIFLDAYPQVWPKLEMDVMNTHHQAYYRKYDKNELRETENPVPVFFLTVGAETEFVFRFFSRGGSTTNVEKMEKALLNGLAILGVGAKTAVGYGRFTPPASEGEIWLDKTLKELCARHHEPDEKKVLRGRNLASLWEAISDPVLKQKALDAIKQRWEVFKLFDSGGRTLKQVKQIYWRE